MTYLYFRYIAYQVPTIARDYGENALYGIPPGGPIAAPPALTPALQGNVAGLGPDAQCRVERLVGAMLAAQDRMRSENLLDNELTLKIFMAPEFYFRPPEESFVSYTYEQYRAIKDVLRETIKGDERFNHWLVIPGTILWKWGWDKSSLKRLNIPGVKENVYFNSAIYVSRADEASAYSPGDKSSKVIEKTQAADKDGIPTKEQKHGNESLLDPSGKATDEMWKMKNEKWGEEWWPKYQTPPKKEKHIFTVGGITFGLEICLEHNPELRIVKHVVSEKFSEKNIQIHLLIAGGMPVQEASVAAIPGGYILRTDGYSNSPSTNCQKIEKYVDMADAGSIKSQKDLDSKAVLAEMLIQSTLEINEGHYLYLPNPEDGHPDFWNDPGRQQRINIYRRQLLP